MTASTSSLAADTKARLDLVAEIRAAGIELKQRGGHYWARCPFHGGGQERTPSLQVTPAKGLWWCHACREGGDVLDFLQRLNGGDFRSTLRAAAARVGVVNDRIERPRTRANGTGYVQVPPGPMPQQAPSCEPLGADLLALLAEWQAALPGSPAAEYLQTRAIPLAIATACGMGYAATAWPGKLLAGKPVLVFPLTDAAGTIVSMAARQVQPCHPDRRWDNLAGKPKAPFLGETLAGSGELWMVEGGVDALALRAAGVDRVVAMMGSSWATMPWHVADIVLALDADATGIEQVQKMARHAALLGKRVRILPPAALGGCKDVAEAWQAGTLSLYADKVPDAHREAWQERVAIMLDAGTPLAIAELDALRDVTANDASEGAP